MPYTDAQLERYNTKPGSIPQYNTIEFFNSFAGWRRFVVSGANGPFKALKFIDGDGVLSEYKPVSAFVPDTSVQDVSSNELCTIRLGRIASQATVFLSDILKNTSRPQERVISCRVSIYEGTGGEAIFTRTAFVGDDGFVIGETDVNITLEMENPAKLQFAPFYDPFEYTGLLGE